MNGHLGTSDGIKETYGHIKISIMRDLGADRNRPRKAGEIFKKSNIIDMTIESYDCE